MRINEQAVIERLVAKLLRVENRRTYRLDMRLSRRESESLRAMADQFGVSMSTVVRKAIRYLEQATTATQPPQSSTPDFGEKCETTINLS